MSRIKLRNLLNLTEQAPQPPQSAPVPAQEKPAGGAPTDSPAPALAQDTSPTPDDPSEYDFTRDFRAFEDAKNKAEAAAKKKLLDKMNKMLLGKKVVANASRGYGQPKTDYTIEKVKKVSVEFWYKDWVVIVSDENDKKFFLTTGVNIKIDQAAPAAPEEPAQADAPQEPNGQPPAPEQGQEAPNAKAEPETPEPTPAPQGQPAAPAKPAVPEPKAPTEPAAQPEPQPEPEQPVQPPEVKKKKKLPVAPSPVAEETAVEDEESSSLNTPVDSNIVQNEIGGIFAEFTNQRMFDVKPYIKKAVTSGKDTDGMYHTEYTLEIPRDVLKGFDPREFALEFRDQSYSSGGPGQGFSRGSVEIQNVGRLYVFKFSLSGGLDI